MLIEEADLAGHLAGLDQDKETDTVEVISDKKKKTKEEIPIADKKDLTDVSNFSNYVSLERSLRNHTS